MKLRHTAAAAALAVAGAVPSPAMAAVEVLFAFVASGVYDADGNQLADMIAALPGYNVTRRFLHTATYSDYSSFDQVWVYDLSTGADNNANQMANYQAIADWYNGRANQSLIVDGRIISSAPFWTAAGGFNGETAWIQNYALKLEGKGGGMVLGTDHNDFQGGINEINARIDIDPFTGFFGSFPISQALVDTLSPLYVPIDTCRDDPTKQCINDNSTTGFAPAGLQANGQFLTPVAYHGTTSTAFLNAAVSATFDSPTFPTPAPPSG